MSKNQNFKNVSLPSYFSGTLIIIFTLYTSVSSLWSVARDNIIFSDFLTNIEPQIKTLESLSGTIKTLEELIFQNSLFNNIVYIFLWSFVGMIVYFGIFILINGASNFGEILNIKSSVSHKSTSYISEFMVRAVFRMFMVILTILYLVLLFEFILAVGIASMKAGSDLSSISDMSSIVSGVAIVVLASHLLTILIRLCFLKVRVFGSSEFAA